MHASITVDNGEEIEKIFAQEETKFQNDRASYSWTRENDKLTFQVEAKDAVALRTALNAITRLLTVHEKIKNV